MIDVEREERRGRDEMMLQGLLPAPSPEQRQSLEAMGIQLDPGEAPPSGPASSLVVARLPTGWTKEIDGARHRVFHLVDEQGRRRVSVFWKAAMPFSATEGPGYGHLSILEPDGFRRRWITEGETVLRKGEYFFWMACLKCRREVSESVRIADAETKGPIVEQLVERNFRWAHERQSPPCGALPADGITRV